MRPLAGRALKLKEGVFDQGVRKTQKEWSYLLYGDEARGAAIYGLRDTLKKAGYPTACVPLDLENLNDVGVLRPLVESRDVARFVNKRASRMINGSIRSQHLNFYKEMMEWPELGGEILKYTENTLSNYVAFKKIALAGGKNTYATAYKDLAHGGDSQSAEIETRPISTSANVQQRKP